MKMDNPITIAVNISAWGSGFDILLVNCKLFVNGILLYIKVPQQSMNKFTPWPKVETPIRIFIEFFDIIQ